MGNLDAYDVLLSEKNWLQTLYIISSLFVQKNYVCVEKCMTRYNQNIKSDFLWPGELLVIYILYTQ